MFKTVVTLFRGSVAAASEELEDRTALLILDQQMRDAAAAVERGKRTLALAIAQDQLVHVGHEIVDRAIGAADLAGEIAGFQTGQSAAGDHPLRRKDQVGPEFLSTFQGLRHLLTEILSVAQIYLEQRSRYATKHL